MPQMFFFFCPHISKLQWSGWQLKDLPREQPVGLGSKNTEKRANPSFSFLNLTSSRNRLSSGHKLNTTTILKPFLLTSFISNITEAFICQTRVFMFCWRIWAHENITTRVMWRLTSMWGLFSFKKDPFWHEGFRSTRPNTFQLM